jgi:hypothetical protein
VNKDDMSDDAELDAFLKGDDALARRLQALPQAVPSAALDAAILQRARDLMAQEHAQETRPQAANDAGANTAAPRRAGLGWRWRVPAGIAATVLAGVFANQAFRASADLEQSAGMPAEQSALILDEEVAARKAPPPMVMVPQVAGPAAVASAPAPVSMVEEHVVLDAAPATEELKKMSPPPPAPEVHVAERAKRAPVQTESSVPVLAAQDKAMAAPPAPPAPVAMGYSGAAAAPAKVQEPQRPMAPLAVRESEPVAGLSQKAKGGVAAKTPAEWLAAIEAMLDAGKDTQVPGEWRKFRQTYPDYPVPQTTEERIKAIQK